MDSIEFIKQEIKEIQRIDNSIDEAINSTDENQDESYINIEKNVLQIFKEEKEKFYIVLQSDKIEKNSINEIIKNLQKTESVIWNAIAKWYSKFIKKKFIKMKLRGVNTTSALKIRKKAKLKLDESKKNFDGKKYFESYKNAKLSIDIFKECDEELDTLKEGNKYLNITNIFINASISLISLLIGKFLL